MNKALNEFKIQAKILLKSARNNQPDAIQRLAKHSGNKPYSHSPNLVYTDLAKLKHCQYVVAREVGFENWQHAHSILSTSDKKLSYNAPDSGTVNMGKFWHNHHCDALINLWFSRYQEARHALLEEPSNYLIPYQNQFIVATKDYINAIALSEVEESLWREVKHDLVASYASEAWDKIAHTRLRNKTG